MVVGVVVVVVWLHVLYYGCLPPMHSQNEKAQAKSVFWFTH